MKYQVFKMSVSKNKIAKEISKTVDLTLNDSLSLLNSFTAIIKKESTIKKVKISRFGTFYFKETLKRIGRNPKTKESYIIKPRKKLNFRASNILKKILNP